LINNHPESKTIFRLKSPYLGAALRGGSNLFELGAILDVAAGVIIGGAVIGTFALGVAAVGVDGAGGVAGGLMLTALAAAGAVIWFAAQAY
jgi:hypothetical protein